MTNLNLPNFLMGREPKTFLIGAGCSADPPSNLPLGRQMMAEILKYTCPKDEIAKVLQLHDMRFETLIEIVRDRFDPDLKIIDYYTQCNQPNAQHFFFAEILKRGHLVMTTNFDQLIEQALLHSDIPKDHIIPVITKADFERYPDPAKLFQEEKLAVFKIHGSPKNVIIGESTKDSLIATLQAFGRNKAGLNIFQLESFKLPVFNNITTGRSLIVMGYSGSDDFDILPTLKTLKNLSRLIWIDHVTESSEIIITYEVGDEIPPERKNLDRIDQILQEYKSIHPHVEVFRVTTNTSQLLGNLLLNHHHISSPNISLTPHDWLTSQFGDWDTKGQYNITEQLYEENGKFHDALRCAKKYLQLVERENDIYRICFALQNVGAVHHALREFKKAMKYYKLALKFATDHNQPEHKGIILNNIGDTYLKQRQFTKALPWLENALQVATQEPKLQNQKYIILNNLGRAHTELGNLDFALKYLQEALDLGETDASLSEKAIHYNNIGMAQEKKGDLAAALEKFTFALRIATQLKSPMNQIQFLGNIARIYQKQQKYAESLDQHQQALKISADLGDYEGMVFRLSRMAKGLIAQKDYTGALAKDEEALATFEHYRLKNPRLKEVVIENISQLKRKLLQSTGS